MSKIVLKKYTDEGWVDAGETSIYDLKHSLSYEDIGKLLEEKLNNFDNKFKKGEEVGKQLGAIHCSLQGELIRFFLGVLCAMATPNFVDARNEVPVETCRKIKAQIESGNLKTGWLI